MASPPAASEFGREPGWVYPSITTGPVTAGRDELPIVCTPAAPKLNAIVSAPGLAFASRTAWRNEPTPLSDVFTTVNVVGTARRSNSSRPSRRELQRPAGFTNRANH